MNQDQIEALKKFKPFVESVRENLKKTTEDSEDRRGYPYSTDDQRIAAQNLREYNELMATLYK